MEYTKKMVLVDPRILQSNTTSAVQNTTAYTQPETGVIDMTLKGLDAGITNILNAPDIPEDIKAKLYNHFLSQFLTMKKKQTDVYRRDIPYKYEVPVVTMNDQPPSTSAEIQEDKIESEIIASVPKTMQKQAKLILERVKNDPQIKWNEKGEVIIQDQTVPNSNMVDLINDLVRKRKNINPTGWKEFASHLYKSNIPRDLVRNPDRWEYMIGQRSALTRSKSPPLSPSFIEDAISDLEKISEQSPAESRTSFRRGRGRGISRGRYLGRGSYRGSPYRGSPYRGRTTSTRQIYSPYNPNVWDTIY